MIVALVLGVGAGLGAAGAFYALAPAPPPLRSALLDLHRRSVPAATPDRAPLARLAEALGARRLVRPGMRADLAITGREESWLFSSALLSGLWGLAVGPALALVLFSSGTALPWEIGRAHV